MDEIKTICQKLKPIIGRGADGLWLAFTTTADMDARRELMSWIQALGAKHLSDKVDDKTILLPPPSKEDAKGNIEIGDVFYGDTKLYPIGLREENFSKHIGIFSITGGGKTNVCQNLLLGLLRRKIPFMVIDWKRSYRDMKSIPDEAVNNIKVFTIGRKTTSQLNWNPLRPPPGIHPRTWISAIADALEKSHISGQGVADILTDLLDKQFEAFGFYDGKGDKYPNFFDAFDELKRTQFKGRRMLWQDSCSRILRTFTFGPASGAFNSRHPIKIETLLSTPIIMELDQELPKPLRVFFADIMLRWIHLYRLAQGETDQLRHVMILEEVHNLFPRNNIEMQATNSLENVFREIRGFGEGLINITQHPSLLPIYILGNCNTQIYLGLQHADDIDTARKALFLDIDDAKYLDALRVGEGIVKIKNRTTPCYVRFPLVPAKKGSITDAMIGSDQPRVSPSKALSKKDFSDALASILGRGAGK